MSGSTTGGGLGYCGGAGGYLGIGLDEYGNYSNLGSGCNSQGGGPGRRPQSLAIRGPLSAYNPYVTGTTVTSGIDDSGVSTRPSPKVVLLTMVPATTGFTITAQFQSASGQAFQTLFENVPFPYAAPATLSIGFGASTGGSTNKHEVQNLTVSTPDDLQVAMTGPSTIAPGNTITYTVAVTNNGSNSIAFADAPTFVDNLPVSITGVTWTCVGSGGAACTGSGSGNIDTSTFTLPQNSVATFTVTGTVSPATTCNSTIENSANADFGPSSSYTDNNPVNNTASVSTTVSCVTVPLPFSFTALGGANPSSVQTSNPVTVAGTNVPSPISITGGEYSINGGAYTATPGTVPPHAQVKVELTASTSYNTASSALLTIGGVSARFSVTTANPGQISFTSALYGVNSAITQVVPVTITRSGGTDGAISANIVDSSGGAILGTVSFGAGVGGTQSSAVSISGFSPGTQFGLRFADIKGGATAGTGATAEVEVTNTVGGGGGALNPASLLVLGFLALLRMRRQEARSKGSH
jgi:uncharacterized repeat protein (TIGR01451 family)